MFYLAGYAGSGKTTLAKELAADAGVVAFCAYTGKAAHVLAQKGCPGATTIHRLIYTQGGDPPTPAAIEKLREEYAKARAQADASKGTPAHERDLVTVGDVKRLLDRALEDAERKGPRFRINPEAWIRNADLIVVDECSMVDERVGRDLLSFKRPVLVLGDPAQLPPVGGAGYFTRRDPDFLLDEVHRQAADSPILRLATLIRQQRTNRVPRGSMGPGCDVVPYGHHDLEARALATEQILVGKNVTRHASNNKIRRLRGLTGRTPVEGDRVICLRNDHDLGLLNGSLWDVVRCEALSDDQTLGLEVRAADDHDRTVQCVAWRHHFEGRESELAPFVKRDAQEFAFGYAITVHKSQGSQWDDVVVFDESHASEGWGWRHLYTAVTRAAKKLTLVT